MPATYGTLDQPFALHPPATRRMQLAAGLLRTTDIKLAEVAERAGYGSEAAFSRAFHRHLGAAPAQWRETR